MPTTTVFFVKDRSSPARPVAATYLVINGQNVVDPNSTPGSTGLYTDSSTLYTDQTLTTTLTNPNNYLIVPADYSVNSAVAFANKISAILGTGQIPTNAQLTADEGTTDATIKQGLQTFNIFAGLESALGTVAADFAPGGSQDLQRTYDGLAGSVVQSILTDSGIPFVGAFKDAASFNLGLVCYLTGIPLQWAEAAGGTLNVWSSAYRVAHGQSSLDMIRPL